MNPALMEKMRQLEVSKPSGQFSKQRNIFFTYKDGSNVVRLVGVFVRTETHYIAPDPKHKKRGLCVPDAFEGSDSIPRMINCLDWDLEKEQPTATKTCPICRLNRIVKAQIDQLGNSLSAKDKQYLESIRQDTRATTTLKWNIIDRAEPLLVEEKPDGSTVKVPGFKVISIGMEAWKGVKGIFEQLSPVDIADPDDGIDIEIIKDHNGMRTCYSARAVMQGKSAKTTPLTDVERAIQQHDLKRLSRRMVEAEKLVDSLHDDLRQFIDEESGSAPAAATAATPAPAAAPKAAAPAPKAAAPAPKAAAPAPKAALPKVEEEPEESEEAATSEEASEEASDESQTSTSDWQCFGTVQDGHPECAQCQQLDDCVAERDKRMKGAKKRAAK